MSPGIKKPFKVGAALPSNQQPLAIVGMGCRLPGASDLDEYWNLIASGRTAYSELPPERLNQEIYYCPEASQRPRTMTRLGGIVSPYKGVRELHYLSVSDVRQSDPAHLELFGVVEDAVESAGWNKDYFQGKKTGVYLGHTRGTGRCGEIVFRTLVPQTARWLQELDAFTALDPLSQERVVNCIVRDVQNRYVGNDSCRPERLAAFSAASLIAKGFNLEGPFLSLNAACASSLAALNYAGEALSLGEIDVAIVGSGSFVEFDSLVLFSRAGSVSRTGSRPFDSQADGLIPAEGYVALVIKSLDKALADNDQILAVIRGFGCSSDGKGKSLWAPREEGQILAVQRAYGDCLSPTRLGYVEAHATSTAVGDATEMAALTKALSAKLAGHPKIPVGSVKANIGHTLETAGLAALAKVVLAIRHQSIPPVANVRAPNPNIDWEASPLYLPRQLQPWERKNSMPRRAGVNSFGIGGLNAHAVVEEFVPDLVESYFEPDAECLAQLSSNGKSTLTRGIDSQVEAANDGGESDADDLVAIIGVGAIAPGGHTAQEFWQATRDGQTHISEPPQSRLNPKDLDQSIEWPDRIVGGFVKDYQYHWRKHKVPPKQVAHADPLQFMLLDAVDQAINDTGITLTPEIRHKTGVVIGSVFGGEFGNALQMGLRLPEFSQLLTRYLQFEGVDEHAIESMIDRYQELLLSRFPSLNDETGSFTSSTLASRITKTFDVMGGGAAIDSGPNSGVTALQISVNALRSKDVDLMICACGQCSLGQFQYELIARNKYLSSKDKINVTSSDCDGIIPGEGAGVVILKRLEDAIRDGNRVYAVVRSIEQIRREEIDEALQDLDQTLAQQLSPGELAYVEVDANGSSNAQAEFAAVESALTFNRRFRVPVAALKEQIGETFGAAALLSIIRACQALAEGRLPGCNSASEKRLPHHLHALPESLSRWNPESNQPASVIVHSVCESTVAGVVLSNVASVQSRKVRGRHSHSDDQNLVWNIEKACVAEPADAPAIFRFAADSVSEILHQLQQAGGNPAKWLQKRQAEGETQKAATVSDSNFRLNIVAQNPTSLRQKFALAEHALSQASKMSNLHGQGIFFGEQGSLPGAKIAFVFPGQGSQYSRMLKSFLESSLVDTETLLEIDRAIRKLVNIGFKELIEDKENTFGTDLEKTQLAILGCEILLSQTLQKIGIKPDFVLGHSFGEYGAIYAAGCTEISRVLELSACRARAVNNSAVTPGQLVCLFCDEQAARKIIEEVAVEAYIANCNSPQQTVIGIPKKHFPEFRDKLEARRIRMKTLAVPFAFHTPLMEDARNAMTYLIEGFAFQDSRLDLISTVTESLEVDGAKLPEILCDQFVKPVRWAKIVADLNEKGVKLFIEVGPNQILTGLNRNILKADENILCVATDDPRSTTEDQLITVLAAKEIFEHCSQRIAPSCATAKLSSVAIFEKEQQAMEVAASSVTPESQLSKSTELKTIERTNPLSSHNVQAADISYRHQESLGHDSSRMMQRFVAYRAKHGNSLATPKLNLDYFEEDGKEVVLALSRKIGVKPDALLKMNYFLENDAILSRTSFAVPGGLHGVFDGLRDALVTEQPVYRWNPQVSKAGIRYIAFGLSGQIGGLIGVNEYGLVVNCALPTQKVPKPPERSQANVVTECLGNCRSIDEAKEILDRKHLVDGSKWLLSHRCGDSVVVSIERRQLLVQGLKSPHVSSLSVENHHYDEVNRSTKGPSTPVNQLQAVLKHGTGDIQAFWKAWEIEFGNVSKPVGFASDLCVVIDPVSMVLGVRFTSNVTKEVRKEIQHFETLFREEESAEKVIDPGFHASNSLHKGNEAAQYSDIFLTLKELERTGASLNGQPPCGDQDRVCTRLVPKLIAANGREKEKWSEGIQGTHVLLLGNNATLEAQLVSMGTRVANIKAWDSSDDLAGKYRELLERFSSVEHIVICGDNAAASSSDGLGSLLAFDYDRDVLSIYRLAQEWFAKLGDTLGDKERTFCVVTRMGGDLGLSGNSPSHIGGAWSGLAKAMYLERSIMVGPDVKTFVLDFPEDATEQQISSAVIREWGQETREAEIGYIAGNRYVLRSVQDVLARSQQLRGLSAENGCWIVTGGARGVTAEIAKALAAQVRGTIHLIGSSPLPNIPKEWLSYDETQLRSLRSEIARKAAAEKRPGAEEWNAIEKAMEIERNLANMHAAGMRVQYHACNVANYQDVAELVASIRRSGEPIVGVVHGAGFEKAARFSSKKVPLVNRTFEAKALGAIHLMVATDSDPIKTFVAFTSISGRYGAIGQTDYGSANEWVTKITARYAKMKPATHAVAMDWHSWDEVGMAARPETKHSPMLKTIKFMPVQEGVEHFLAEVCQKQFAATMPAAEVIITDWGYHKLYFPDPSIPVNAFDQILLVEPKAEASIANQIEDASSSYYQLQTHEWYQEPVDPIRIKDLEGLTCVVGSSSTAQQIQKLMTSQGKSVLSWPSPRTAEDWEQLKCCLSRLAIKNLFWLSGLDEAAALGAGWRQHRERLDSFVAQPIALMGHWLDNQATQAKRLIVAARSPALNDSDFFGGGIGTPEGSWLKGFCISRPDVSDRLEICRLVWLSNQLNSLDESIRIANEASVLGKETEVHRCREKRYVPKSFTKALETTQRHTLESQSGIWVVAALDAHHGAVLTETFAKKSSTCETIDLRGWLKLERDASAISHAKDLRGVEAAQFSEIVLQLEAIRQKHGDRIQGILITSDGKNQESHYDLICCKLLVQLMQCCLPDKLEQVAIVASHSLAVTAAWLKWYSIQQGMKAVAIEFDRQPFKNSADVVLGLLVAENPELHCRVIEIGTDPSIEEQSQLVDRNKSYLALQPKKIDTEKGTECEVIVDPVKDPFLAQHRFRDLPLLPLVAIAEIMVQSAVQTAILRPDAGFRLRNLFIVNGLKFFNERPGKLFVRFEPSDGEHKATLYHVFSDSHGRTLEKERTIATANVTNVYDLNDQGGAPCLPNAPWHPVIFQDEGAVIYHGAPFRCMNRTQFFENGILAELFAQSDKALGGERTGEWLIPMGVIDSSLYACGILAWLRDYMAVAIPAGIESITIHRRALENERYAGSFVVDSLSDNMGVFSGKVFDSSGKMLFQLDGYKATIVKQRT